MAEAACRDLAVEGPGAGVVEGLGVVLKVGVLLMDVASPILLDKEDFGGCLRELCDGVDKFRAEFVTVEGIPVVPTLWLTTVSSLSLFCSKAAGFCFSSASVSLSPSFLCSYPSSASSSSSVVL